MNVWNMAILWTVVFYTYNLYVLFICWNFPVFPWAIFRVWWMQGISVTLKQILYPYTKVRKMMIAIKDLMCFSMSRVTFIKVLIVKQKLKLIKKVESSISVARFWEEYDVKKWCLISASFQLSAFSLVVVLHLLWLRIKVIWCHHCWS